MEVAILITGLSILGVLGFLAYTKIAVPKENNDDAMLLQYIDSLRKEIRDVGSQTRKETEDRLDKINERIARGLEHSSTTLQKQFSESAVLIKSVTERLTKLDETNKQVLGFSEQMQSLENILKNPKQRGILGEYFLESLLSQVFQPNQYKIQYKFSNGEIVDAAVFMQDKVIPIDAKFSLEKYNKIMEEKDETKRGQLEKEFKMDVKNRIDETAKYIRPKENTMDFAFMFIPAEGIYYNLLIYKVGTLDVNANDLIEYAFKKKVIIVSPISFFAYLQTVLEGMKNVKMQESMGEIKKNIEDLGRHLNSYETFVQKMGNSLGTTVNMYNSAHKEFKKIDKDIYKITDGVEGGKIEAFLIDKPQVTD
ncbi:DNA recombination protein RmuC [Candidatus Peregrinibacteria bacterium CG_4_10_14_0_2_um_filter_38_24]|nr:MAG: DNA recombination protein RmuC [Candidatus Peregrinibacteria bacterium CG_4_10_14_0_2_um_filter_38_24]PJC39177.1 MAG: DNA recombination protein RmuC [Candidatus Peregrinibacteria bacterium CG_4_9_14_0_2_um_filter_38_9]